MDRVTSPAPDGQMAQVLIEIGKLSTQVAVIGTKQDGITEKIASLPIKDHEFRLRSLERFKWMLLGASLAGGGAAGALVAEVVKTLR